MPESVSQPVSSSNPGTGSGGPPPQDQFTGMLFMLVPMFIFLYLLIIRPQRKEQKRKEELLASLKVKDKVLTIIGMYGTVVDIDGDDVVLLVDAKKDVKIRMRRSAIEGIIQEQGEKPK